MNIEHTRLSLAQFSIILAQLALVLVAMNTFHIERSQNLPLMLPLIFVGFAVHAWLPPSFRPPFFLALSILSIVFVLGLTNSLWLLGIGAVLFSICHLPAGPRLGSLLAVGALLAGIRLNWIPQFDKMNLGSEVMPVLGAMFMFRLSIYVYDFRHARQLAPVTQRLAYFFMLPNVCFPLFPVIDYQGFLREYYSAPACEIYQKGLRWIMRGTIHLLIYRLVYVYASPSLEEVSDLFSVAQYMVSSYLLYVRISGLFHIAIGILCLFGYNLPETHRLYFLASSFNDFWRRINIYWKNFVLKIFYYPLFMGLRKRSVTEAVVIASLTTLILSWILHSYQAFWLRGVFPFTLQDVFFWSFLGVAVAVNSVIELKRGRDRTSKMRSPGVRSALLLSVKTSVMFCFMSALWSFWTANSIDEWLAILAMAVDASAQEVLALFGVIAGAVVLGAAIQLVAKKDWVLSNERQPSFNRSVTVTATVALLIIIIGMPWVGKRLDSRAQDVLESLTSGYQINYRDREIQTRGYYEELLSVEIGD